MRHQIKTRTRAMKDQKRPLIAAGITAVLVLSLTIATSLQAAAREMPASFADLVEKLSPAVVNISTVQTVTARQRSPFPPGSPFEEFFDEFFDRSQPRGGDGEPEPRTRRARSLGSGFIIDASGLVVTNNHVIQDADEVTVRTVDGEEYEAEIVGRDSEGDLALLRIEADVDLPHVEWGNSAGARVGDWVLSIGNPFGLGGSVTAGIVSAHHREISGGPFDDFIQTDASINRGNSGGPLFNLEGEVIGVNTAIFTPTGGNVGIAFAIPSNQAKRVVAQLQEFGYARRGYLGVDIQPVDKLTAEALGLGEAQGAIVSSVRADSPAEEAGLMDGDIIIEVNGEIIENSSELVRVVSALGVNQKADLVVIRGEGRKSLTVMTGERPRPEDAAQEVEPDVTQELGMELSDLNVSLREQFEIPDNVDGALVLQVASNLRGRVARGDVIVEVNRKPVKNAAAVKEAIAAVRAEGRSAALLRLYRSANFYFVPIPLDGEE